MSSFSKMPLSSIRLTTRAWPFWFAKDFAVRAIRRRLLVNALDSQPPLDPSSQSRYGQTHQGGLLCGGSDVGMSPLFWAPVSRHS